MSSIRRITTSCCRAGGAALSGVFLLLAVAGCGPGNSAPAGAIDGPAAGGPAERIVTLSPHLTELAYAAGAGSRLIGTVEFSNHPPAARTLPRVGDAFRVDTEAILALQPDLVLGWPSGNSPRLLEQLRRLGLRVVALEPRTLADIGAHIQRIGELAGTGDIARMAAGEWRRALEDLAARYAHRRPVRVFYQVSPRPLITATKAHFIGQAVELCGGENVFADLPGLTPAVNEEAVITAAPEVIVASALTPGPMSTADAGLEAWRSWPRVPAVAQGHLFVVDLDLLGVPGPRMLAGIRLLCGFLETARDG